MSRANARSIARVRLVAQWRDQSIAVANSANVWRSACAAACSSVCSSGGWGRIFQQTEIVKTPDLSPHIARPPLDVSAHRSVLAQAEHLEVLAHADEVAQALQLQVDYLEHGTFVTQMAGLDQPFENIQGRVGDRDVAQDVTAVGARKRVDLLQPARTYPAGPSDKGLQSLRAPEPDVVVPIRGRASAAVGRAHVERVIVPPAAAQDGLISGRRPLRIPCRTAPIVVFIKPIGHPFPDIAGHIVCAIGALSTLIAPNGRSITIAIIGCTIFPVGLAVRIAKIRPFAVKLIPPWVDLSVRTACRFFPFRLGGQAFPGPGAIRLRVLLAHLDHRMLLQAGNAAAWTPRRAPVGTVDQLQLLLPCRRILSPRARPACDGLWPAQTAGSARW